MTHDTDHMTGVANVLASAIATAAGVTDAHAEGTAVIFTMGGETYCAIVEYDEDAS
jgi:hypothetical protein